VKKLQYAGQARLEAHGSSVVGSMIKFLLHKYTR